MSTAQAESAETFTNSEFASDLDGFYRRHHRDQTMSAAVARREKYGARQIGRATVWDRFMALREINDESDADLEGMTQFGHALQTANAIVHAGLDEDWITAGLVHDLGKILIQYGEPQEFVVGDIFPMGCRYSPRIIKAEYLRLNPDAQVSAYQTDCGIYEPGCGLDRVVFSYGHDEYIHQVLGDRLPRATAWMIRYHSFQSIAAEYLHLFSEEDRRLRESHMKAFAAFDLYTKNPSVASDRYLGDYESLLKRRFPDPIDW